MPRRSGLDLKAHNGGITIADVEGEMQFETQNGGVTLKRLGGDVRGKTTNGGLKVRTGRKHLAWQSIGRPDHKRRNQCHCPGGLLGAV